MGIKVAVVIPYYQRRSGILAKAVRSALAQQGGCRLDIIVVDDGSPVPARSELAALQAAHPGVLRLFEQPNGGPAAARNRALEAVAPDTAYVAFLDSDDEWQPEHLANALAALEAGHDIYFADHYQLNQTVTAFNRAGRLVPEQHPQVGDAGHLRSYHGDMLNQILTGNVIGTSTVVFRWSLCPTLRFREEYVYAGEDYLFWLELAQRSSRIAFSTRCECTYCEGVNIFAGSGWGTEHSLIRLHYEMKYKKAVGRLVALNDEQRVQNGAAVRSLRRSFVADVLHRLSHRKPFAGVMLKQARVDPLSVLCFVPLALHICLRR